MADTPSVIPVWSELYLTDNGINMRQKAIAEGYRIYFPYAEIGEGRPEDPQDVWTISSLVNFKKTVPVKKSYAVTATHHMIVHIDNIDYTEEIFATELAMYAQLLDADGSPVTEVLLYGYAFTIHGAETIPIGNGQNRIFEIGLSIHVSRASEVKIIYDGSLVYVTRDELDAMLPTEEVATIEHGLNTLPVFALYTGRFAAGVKGYGDGPYGGTSLTSIPVRIVPLDSNTVKVFTIPAFEGVPEVTQLSPNEYSLVYADRSESLTLILR